MLLTSCSTALTVTAHTAADGHLPHPATTVLLTGVLGWVSTATADRTRGMKGTLLVLGVAQLLMHGTLGAFSGHPVGGPLMLASHAGATAATAVLVVHAETMLAVAVSALFLLLPTIWRGPPAPVTRIPRLVVVRPAAGTLTIEVLLHRIHRRRGPPRCS